MTDDLENYKPGEWFMAHTVDQMQAFFNSRLPVVREAAKACGYAIGVHGSERRDFDLIAVPWREDSDAPDRLAHKIAIAACGITREGAYEWEKKPAGRIATSIPACWAGPWSRGVMGVGHIDLSVMPPRSTR